MSVTGASLTLMSRVTGANTMPICSSTAVGRTDSAKVSLGSSTRNPPLVSTLARVSARPLLLVITTSRAESCATVL